MDINNIDSNEEEFSSSAGFGKKVKKASDFKKSITSITIKYIVLLIMLFITALVVFYVVFTPTKQISVSNVVGKPLVQAMILLQEKGLYVNIQEQYTSDPSNIGKVLEQKPKAGTPMRSKRTVFLTVSKGAVVSEVPDITGELLNNAEDILENEFSGFDSLLKIGTISKISSLKNAGVILGQNPEGGTKISNAGTKIDLIVSRGDTSSSSIIYDMRGLKYYEVYSFLEKSQKQFEFYISEENNIDDTELEKHYLEAGVIVEQSPKAGVELEDKDIIRIGVRGKLRVQDNILKPEGDLTDDNISNVDIKIAEVPVKNVTGAIKVIKTEAKNSIDIIKTGTYGDTITFPYAEVVGVTYIIQDKQGNNIWLYTITE